MSDSDSEYLEDNRGSRDRRKRAKDKKALAALGGIHDFGNLVHRAVPDPLDGYTRSNAVYSFLDGDNLKEIEKDARIHTLKWRLEKYMKKHYNSDYIVNKIVWYGNSLSVREKFYKKKQVASTSLQRGTCPVDNYETTGEIWKGIDFHEVYPRICHCKGCGSTYGKSAAETVRKLRKPEKYERVTDVGDDHLLDAILEHFTNIGPPFNSVFGTGDKDFIPVINMLLKHSCNVYVMHSKD